MPTEDPLQRFMDIIEKIDLISDFTTGLSREQFEGDVKTRLAVERCMQIITEAAAKLGATAEEMAPDIPWRKIRGMGNELRHGYNNLNENLIWKTIQDDLAPLRAACATAIERLQQEK